MPKAMTTAGKTETQEWRRHLLSYAMIAPAIAFLAGVCHLSHVPYHPAEPVQGQRDQPVQRVHRARQFRKHLLCKKRFPGSAEEYSGLYRLHCGDPDLSWRCSFAVWMFEDRKINKIAQTAFFTPHLVASVSCAFIWSWLFSSDSYGLFNTVLKAFGAAPVNWLGDTRTAMGCIITMNVWKGIGYYALIILSALKAIPPEIYEAARLDNASRYQDLLENHAAHAVPPAFFPACHHHHRVLQGF